MFGFFGLFRNRKFPERPHLDRNHAIKPMKSAEVGEVEVEEDEEEKE